MNLSKSKSLRMETQIAVFLMIVTFLMSSCGKTETGTLVGVSAASVLDEAKIVELENIDYRGTLLVKLDDGSEVNALCNKELWSKLQGGQKLEIAPTDSEFWKVIEILEEEKPKDDTEKKTVIVTGRLLKEDGSAFSNASVSLLVVRGSKDEKEKIEYAEPEGAALRRIIKGYVTMVSHGDIEGGMLIRDGKVLTPSYTINKDDKGQFRLEIAPEDFPEGTEFMLSAQIASPGLFEAPPNNPLFDEKGKLLRFDSTLLIGTLKFGDIIAK